MNLIWVFLVGVGLSMDAFAAAICKGLTTFGISFFGVQVGKFFGLALKDKAQVTGGVILIFLGTKILLEHLGILVLWI